MVKKYKKKNGNGLNKFNRGVRTVGNVARTAVSALGAAKLALSLINPEFKYFDRDFSLTPDSTGQTRLINVPIQGTDADNRIGRSIKIKSISVNFVAIKNTASAVNGFLRCMLVLDKDPKATAITIAEILQDTGAPITSPRNLDFRKRIVIMKDWYIPLGLNGANSYHRKIYKKSELHEIFNSGNSGTITDIEENAIYFVAVSDVTTNMPSVVCYTRIRFLDN